MGLRGGYPVLLGREVHRVNKKSVFFIFFIYLFFLFLFLFFYLLFIFYFYFFLFIFFFFIIFFSPPLLPTGLFILLPSLVMPSFFICSLVPLMLPSLPSLSLFLSLSGPLFQ